MRQLERAALLSLSSWLNDQQLGTVCPHCSGEGWQALPVSPGALGGPRLGHLLCVPRCVKHFTLALARQEGSVVRTLDPICSTLAPASATCELRVRPWPSSLTPLCLSILIQKMGITTVLTTGFPGDSDGKASVCSAGDLGSIAGLGRYPGEGNGNPLQYSYLENHMDRGAW